MAVHDRAAAAHTAGEMSKRGQLLLDLIMDIKNNKRPRGGDAASAAAAAGGGGGGRKGGAAAVLQPGVLKWLRGLGVDEVQLVNLSWAKLVAPEKKGEGRAGNREAQGGGWAKLGGWGGGTAGRVM